MTILKQIDRELKQHIDQGYKAGSIRYFKEKIKVIGVRSKIVNKISQKYWKNLSTEVSQDGGGSKLEIFNLCEQLLKTGYSEKISIALDWTFRLKKDFEKSDFKIFTSWLSKYISNWASDDDLCTHPLGYLIYKFPEFLPQLQKLTKSKNRWERRASAVTFIYPIRYDKKFLPHVFKTAKILLQDQDDLVQKGYGWMLKVASQKFPADVLKFINQHKSKMPRTALRYAIEKYPQRIRREILKN
ncbi:MAG: DNA alkylation repair protein [Patescibacteria group bacterium]|jgi:3-methyladenine DNA glycosylase AlkD